MAKKRELCTYLNENFASLRDPMRGVMEAYGNAERWFAHIKEVTWAVFGMKHLTDAIHALEHVQPERVDSFANAIHQFGLPVEYPPIGEWNEPIDDLDRVFDVCVGIVDEIDTALSIFIKAANSGETEALARQAEQLQVENSADRTKLLEAWAQWDNGNGYASFDGWCEDLFERGDDA